MWRVCPYGPGPGPANRMYIGALSLWENASCSDLQNDLLGCCCSMPDLLKPNRGNTTQSPKQLCTSASCIGRTAWLGCKLFMSDGLQRDIARCHSACAQVPDVLTRRKACLDADSPCLMCCRQHSALRMRCGTLPAGPASEGGQRPCQRACKCCSATSPQCARSVNAPRKGGATQIRSERA